MSIVKIFVAYGPFYTYCHCIIIYRTSVLLVLHLLSCIIYDFCVVSYFLSFSS